MASIPSGPSKNLLSPGRAVSSPLESMAGAWVPITNLCQEHHSLTDPFSFFSSSYTFAQVYTMLQPQPLGLLPGYSGLQAGQAAAPWSTEDPFLRSQTPVNAAQASPVGVGSV